MTGYIWLSGRKRDHNNKVPGFKTKAWEIINDVGDYQLLGKSVSTAQIYEGTTLDCTQSLSEILHVVGGGGRGLRRVGLTVAPTASKQ